MADTKKESFHEIIKDHEFLQQLRHKVLLSESTVTVVCDKLNLRECEDLVRHVKFNFSLVSVVLRNKIPHQIVTDIVNMEEAKKFIGTVFYTSFIIENFMRVLSNLIFQSDKLKHIVFVKIPSTFGLSQFCSALRHNRSLTILHIEDCELGDEGCIQICQALRRCPVSSLALINCKITSGGIQWISWLIKEQSMLRKMVKWKPRTHNDSPQEIKPQGVRKLNINDNPKIGDNGAKFLISTLFEDNWVKHVHLQNIGITDNSCVEILKLLQHNHMISIFDIERNSIKSANMLSFINICLTSRNTKCGHNLSEFHFKSVRNLAVEDCKSKFKIDKSCHRPNETVPLMLKESPSVNTGNTKTFENTYPAQQYELKKNLYLNGKSNMDHNIHQNLMLKKSNLHSNSFNFFKDDGNFKNISSENETDFLYLSHIEKSEPSFYNQFMNKTNVEGFTKNPKNILGNKGSTVTKCEQKIKESDSEKKPNFNVQKGRKVHKTTGISSNLKRKTKYINSSTAESNMVSQSSDCENNKIIKNSLESKSRRQSGFRKKL